MSSTTFLYYLHCNNFKCYIQFCSSSLALTVSSHLPILSIQCQNHTTCFCRQTQPYQYYHTHLFVHVLIYISIYVINYNNISELQYNSSWVTSFIVCCALYQSFNYKNGFTASAEGKVWQFRLCIIQCVFEYNWGKSFNDYNYT
jgi:hypothetical protein